MRHQTTLSIISTVLFSLSGLGVAVAQEGGPSVTLLEAGAEPRTELRYTVGADHRERLSIEVAAGVDRSSGPTGDPAQTWPSFRIEVAVGPTQVQDDGSLRYDLRIPSFQMEPPADMDPAVAATIRADLERLQQAHGWIVQDQTGLALDGRFRTPEAVPMRIRALLGNIRQSLVSVPFPTEAVGVGARWQTTRQVERDDFTVTQTVTYTLTQLEGTTGRLLVTLNTTAEPQTYTNADGQSIDLQLYSTTGAGQVRFDLGKISPISEIDAQTMMRGFVGDESVFLGLWFGASVNRLEPAAE